jgi:hypothetical protein
MGWRFKVYESEDGFNQPRWWYLQQTRAVRAAFDGQPLQLSLRKDAPESASFTEPGYREVLRIKLDELPDGGMKISLVGLWQKDSINFVILLCCEEVWGDYDPPLYRALELRKACDSRKGRIYDHKRSDEPPH